ncbi:putative quinol monooxygenase [Vibrio methylphosphonaticus]|uniref:putative quinol monooxygenase n=1 Tax=Vibrio methylphosphonaticus TaxID=2946866 RepID=UPI002029BF54|nr:antibiotic biosynthesis monooxygenase [Vibrio methylphosphonaticus]MCL9777165.1 antibiotic biosynthesis monooxygenase [Vibrio methylphosphonaticus]
MSKVILKGYIVVPTEERKAVLEALVTHKALTLKEDGCLVFEVDPDANDQTRFNVYEEFVDRSAFEHHQDRVKASEWGKVTVNVARHYQIIE